MPVVQSRSGTYQVSINPDAVLRSLSGLSRVPQRRAEYGEWSVVFLIFDPVSNFKHGVNGE